MSDIQLTGNLSIGAIDFSDNISTMMLKRTRNSISIPATLGSNRETERAGSLKESLEINFFSSMAAASLWAELYDAIDTDLAELPFSGNLGPGATSADNPLFAGTIIILGIDTGAAVGTLRQQTQTYPITAAGITKTIAP